MAHWVLVGALALFGGGPALAAKAGGTPVAGKGTAVPPPAPGETAAGKDAGRPTGAAGLPGVALPIEAPPAAVQAGERPAGREQVFAGGGAKSAVPVAGCDNPAALGAGTQLRVGQRNGAAVIEITDLRGMGRKVEVEYGDELYRRRVGADGRARVSFGLTAAENQFVISMTEAPPVTCAIGVPDFARLNRVILRWHDPVQLDLNVLEPGGRPGEFGHLNRARTNGALDQGIGQMDVVGDAPTDGATAEMSYAITDSRRIPSDGVFTYRLDYVTRGARPAAPYCGDNPLATPRFEFITIRDGTVNARKMSVNNAPCGEELPDARRLMPIRQ